MDTTNKNNFENSLKNIKSEYFFINFSSILEKNRLYKIVKYNKTFQKILNITKNDYENFNKIEIEMIPINISDKNKFIYIKDEYLPSYHIYFNDDKNEIKRDYFTKDEIIKKIKIIIDEDIKSFDYLFYCVDCIEKITFTKFNRKDINNMCGMFDGCSSLKELNLNNFKTNNVTSMRRMFNECSSLKKLNLSNFMNDNVTDMSYLFYGCSSLEEINLCNFDTSNVTNMSSMFAGCSSIKELNLSHFRTKNVTSMGLMFAECSSLKELNINYFSFKNSTIIDSMFSGCSDELMIKIRNQNINIRDADFI